MRCVISELGSIPLVSVVRWVDEVEGGTYVIPQSLHHLLDALHDLRVGERSLGERRSVERRLGRHRI